MLFINKEEKIRISVWQTKLWLSLDEREKYSCAEWKENKQKDIMFINKKG